MLRDCWYTPKWQDALHHDSTFFSILAWAPLYFIIQILFDSLRLACVSVVSTLRAVRPHGGSSWALLLRCEFILLPHGHNSSSCMQDCAESLGADARSPLHLYNRSGSGHPGMCSEAWQTRYAYIECLGIEHPIDMTAVGVATAMCVCLTQQGVQVLQSQWWQQHHIQCIIIWHQER